MKKIIYLFLVLSFSFTACNKDDDTPSVVEGCTDPAATNYDPSATSDDGSCIYPPIATINDSLAGLWHLTHYDIGNGLESADSGQYIHFLNDDEFNVNVQIIGWTWFGDFNYEATSDSLITMNQEMAIVNIDNVNLHLYRESSFSLVYDLYFEK